MFFKKKHNDALHLLMKVKPSERNKAWQDALFKHVASHPVWFFSTGGSIEITGPDGLPYIAISLTDLSSAGSPKAALSDVFENMVHHNLGLVVYDEITDDGSAPLHVFSAIDLKSYKNTGIFTG